MMADCELFCKDIKRKNLIYPVNKYRDSFKSPINVPPRVLHRYSFEFFIIQQYKFINKIRGLTRNATRVACLTVATIAPRLEKSDIHLTSNSDLAQLSSIQCCGQEYMPRVEGLTPTFCRFFFCSGFCHDLAGKTTNYIKLRMESYPCTGDSVQFI